ncbi:hypothetical protein NEMBOFW57_005136 [Staphylotrichum longicolle]|uniref:Uncharacterized protein n=1 Tax=Staphylotrichum longicolle TaxID=669026 RepID=A0AAD4EW93_9PEZI|nr:hypothetical protein NEMBOFW57_005136 [Staphylotrichum longicolle]
MLRLGKQGRSILRTTPFICSACRALLASGAGGASRLPGAVARLCAARHSSSTRQSDQQQTQQRPDTPEPPEPIGSALPTIPDLMKRRRPKPVSKIGLWRSTLDALNNINKADDQQPPPPSTEPQKKAAPPREGKLLEDALAVLQKALRKDVKEDPQPASKATKSAKVTAPKAQTAEKQKAEAQKAETQKAKEQTTNGKSNEKAKEKKVKEEKAKDEKAKETKAKDVKSKSEETKAKDAKSKTKEDKAKETKSKTKEDKAKEKMIMEQKLLEEKAKPEKAKLKKGKQETNKHEKAKQENVKQETTKKETAKQEKAKQEKAKQEKAIQTQEKAKQETAKREKSALGFTKTSLAKAFGLAGVAAAATAAKPAAKPVEEPAIQPLGALSSKIKVKAGKTQPLTISRIDARSLNLIPIRKPQPPVPRLAYGLDRVLFNPGVYHIQDPRSRVFNFDPYLERIMPIKEFDFNAIKQYVTSSKDTTLIDTAAEYKKKYTGSTSSMTSTLSHFHYLLSAWRPINPALLSRGFDVESYKFTRIMRAPSATFLHWKDGVYAIDADKEYDTANVLSMLGKSMEKFLTLPKEEFEKYRKTNSDQLTEEDRNGPESYHYTTLGDFMMRSQLDAYDPRLPGTGMFDLKTRAVVTIRMDARDYHKGMGYEIRERFGQWESFEREYYDMIRSAFLKYSLQVRMGRMDGIFVAYHNTERIFGFQYIPLPEMDLALHGQADTTLGDREFKLSLHLLNKVLDRASAKYPNRSLRLHFEARGEDSAAPFIYIFAKPVTPVEIDEIQGATAAKVEEFERRMMGLVTGEGRSPEEDDVGEEAVEEAEEADVDEVDGEGEGEVTSSAAWEDVMAKVEDELEDEEHGMTFVRESIEDALRESGLLRTTAPDETQRYVDAFLEALISNGRPAAERDSDYQTAAEEPAEDLAEELIEDEEGAETSETETLVEEQVEEEAEKDAEEQTTQTSETEPPVRSDEVVPESGATPTGTPTVAEQVVEQAEELVDEQIEKPAEEQREVPTEKTEDEAQTPTAADSPTDEPTLKDLILKLATQIRAGPSEKRTSPAEDEDVVEEETPEHSVRLRKIERLLTELTEEADEAGRGEENVLLESGTVSPEEAAAELEKRATEPAKSQQTTPTTPEQPASKPQFSTKGFRDEANGGELYGLILTIRNKVDGEYVVRPENLDAKQRWTVEYALEEIPERRANTLYRMVLNRRRNLLYPDDGYDKDAKWYHMFRGRLDAYSQSGRSFRRREDARLRDEPVVHVYGADGPVSYPDVFPAEGKKKESGAAVDGSGGGGREDKAREEESLLKWVKEKGNKVWE